MGWFVQITSDIGTPVFQTFKNYPDVSFASSALFHALVTASVKAGFVPSVLRAQDAAIGFAVHGPEGSRLSIVVVSSEFAVGATRDLETHMQWRLRAIFRGALIAAGAELLWRQEPVETLRRLLAQRLSPMVARLMAEEPLPGILGRIPLMGLAAIGSGTEWLPALACGSGAASCGGGDPLIVVDAAFKRLIGSLPAGGGAVLAGLSPIAIEEIAAVLSWQGRAIAATSAFRAVHSVDRALLLSLADEIGPPSFEHPSRSLALEALDGLWLPSNGGFGAPEGSPRGPTAPDPSVPLGAPFAPGPYQQQQQHQQQQHHQQHPHHQQRQQRQQSPLESSSAAKRYRMVSIRLYPTLSSRDLRSAGDLARPSPVAEASQRTGGGEGIPPDEGDLMAGLLGEPPSEEEAICVWGEEASLVFSVLEPCSAEANEDGRSAARHFTAEDLHQCVDFCGSTLQDLWAGLRNSPQDDYVFKADLANVLAALLFDEASHDVVVVPSGWHTSRALPWRCPLKRRKVDTLRRLMYWLRALAPLSPELPQQYVCCENYAIGAMRRDDGLHCWAIMHIKSDVAQATKGCAATNVENVDGDIVSSPARSSQDQDPVNQPTPVMGAVAALLSRVPGSLRDLRSAFRRL